MYGAFILHVCHSVSGNSNKAPTDHFVCRLNCGWFVTCESLWIDVDRCGLIWMVDLLQVMHCGTGGWMWLDLNGWFVTGVALWDRRMDVAWPEWLICYRCCIVGQEGRCGLTWMARRCRTLVSNWTRQHVMRLWVTAPAISLASLLSLCWTVSSSLCTSSIPLPREFSVPTVPYMRTSHLVHSHFATVVNREFSEGR